MRVFFKIYSVNDSVVDCRVDGISARNRSCILSLSNFVKNSTLNSSQDSSKTLMDFHQVVAVPISCDSIARHQPDMCIFSCDKTDSELLIKRTGSSAFFSKNSDNEALAACKFIWIGPVIAV